MLALRNAAPPIIVMTGIIVGFLLGGAVLIETVYNLNGIGQYAVQAVTSADYAPIQAFVLVAVTSLRVPSVTWTPNGILMGTLPIRDIVFPPTTRRR